MGKKMDSFDDKCGLKSHLYHLLAGFLKCKIDLDNCEN